MSIFADNSLISETNEGLQYYTIIDYQNLYESITRVVDYQIVNSKYQYRPDLIAREYYRNPDYQLLIMQYNNMTIQDFVVGKNLKIPLFD